MTTVRMTARIFQQIKRRRKLASFHRFTLATMTLLLLGVAVSKLNAAVITNKTLQSASFQTQDDLVFAFCVVNACTSPRIFDPALDVVCPAATGKTCTYYIHLESQVQVTPQDAGLFRFLVDGAAPGPGPTDPNGFFKWLENDPDSNLVDHFEVKSYTVVAKVTNSSQNQSHSIEVQIGCADTSTDGGGCGARSGFSSLEVKVFTP